jgi:hypothetical protein
VLEDPVVEALAWVGMGPIGLVSEVEDACPALIWQWERQAMRGNR